MILDDDAQKLKKDADIPTKHSYNKKKETVIRLHNTFFTNIITWI